MNDPQQPSPIRGFCWELIGPGACMLAAAVVGISQIALAGSEDDRLSATMYAIAFAAVFLGFVGRLGIPIVQQRSRLPDAVQDWLLGAMIIAGTVIVLQDRSSSILALAFAYPGVFPALVPQAIDRRLARWPAGEDHNPTGPRWQDLTSSADR